MRITRLMLTGVLFGILCGVSRGAQTDPFAHPPASDRPWVYWFWKNGNISREGITADLEAMERVGIGGVIMMEVALSVPPGDVEFFSDPWRELFAHAVTEAGRLGLVVSMNSAPGWTGSGGPWVTPEQSMQKVVAGETNVSSPRHFKDALPQPETERGFYEDIAVLAFPTPENGYLIADIAEKALYERGPISSKPGVRAAFPSTADYKQLQLNQVIPSDRLVDLSDQMDATGQLEWDVPAGHWTILRFGRTSTGQTNRPAPLPGLECDKLDKKALDAHFRDFTAKLLDDVGELAGKTLVATHLDSWEVGAQNWTGEFRLEFLKRRGYDPLPYLPVMTGRVIEDLEVSERFLWDLRQTVSEMIVENHGRHMHELAQQHGLWFSVEPYDMTPCDDMTLGATADVPMCEFWSKGFDTRYSVKEATSVAHVYGKPVVAAEAFTSVDRWLFHPASVKALGDWAFSEGVNRFVIHRYIHQPFLQARPGLSLGPHGLHYERTQTWWEFSKPWHEYLARCQHVLRQGRFVADILYLSPEGAPNVFQAPNPPPEGYKFDACTPEALLTRVSVQDGRLVLPEGTAYRLLVLPKAEAMTPIMLRKIEALVEAGATVVGAPPCKSPSLSGYPQCDEEVKQLADTLWGSGPAEAVEHPVGEGRIIRFPDVPRENPFQDAMDSVAQARWIWHDEGRPAVSAPVGKLHFQRAVTLDKDTPIQSAQVVMTADNAFTLYVNGRLAGAGDDFQRLYPMDVTSLVQSGDNILAVAAENGGDQPNPAGLIGVMIVQYGDGRLHTVYTDSQWISAVRVGRDWTGRMMPGYGSTALELGPIGMGPWGTPGGPTQQESVYPESNEIVALLNRMGVPPDFAADSPLRYAHRETGKTDIYFVSNGQDKPVTATCTFRVAGKRPELWHPETGRKRQLPQFSPTEDGRTVVPLRFDAIEAYFVVFESTPPDAPVQLSGLSEKESFPVLASLMEVAGPWQVSFDPDFGGPDGTVPFDELEDWTNRPEESIRYYSGAATYSKTIDIPAEMLSPGRRLYLDLGQVEVIAAVKLNGKELGIAWKPPFRVEITDAAQTGPNHLEVKVVNLWPNRMIGDEHLPPDSDRHANGTLKQWPQWLLDGNPSPTGRHTFATWRHWTEDSPLLPSGLLGPVSILQEE